MSKEKCKKDQLIYSPEILQSLTIYPRPSCCFNSRDTGNGLITLLLIIDRQNMQIYDLACNAVFTKAHIHRY